MKTKVYLASPFFNDEETKIYDKVIKLLRLESDLDVFVPREHEIPGAWDMANRNWAEAVFAVDLIALQQADIVVVLNFGMYSDSGTAWECGYAYGTGKKVLNILCGKEGSDYSLMMTNGTSATVSLDTFRTLSLGRCFNLEKEHNEKIMQK
jgi:nucleoside 2-deoxyribosyltransferase